MSKNCLATDSYMYRGWVSHLYIIMSGKMCVVVEMDIDDIFAIKSGCK